jgi:putative transposase
VTTQQETLRAMNAMKETRDRHMFEQYQVIHLHLKGYQIAKIVLRSDKTVSNYIKAYRVNGLDGLERGLPTGALRTLTEK